MKVGQEEDRDLGKERPPPGLLPNPVSIKFGSTPFRKGGSGNQLITGDGIIYRSE